MIIGFKLTPLTYQIDAGKMLNMLPHKLLFWVIAFIGPFDTRITQVLDCDLLLKSLQVDETVSLNAQQRM